MKIVVGIATQNHRSESLKQTIKSLIRQCDKICVYNNSTNPFDYTSHAKFYQLQFIKKPVYFFSCDDDLIYPSDYVERMIAGIKKHNCIVTAHGRILVEGQNSYYHGKHLSFRHNYEVPEDITLDTCGTGVTAFRTDYFNPVDLYQYPVPRMTDLAFSHEAAKQNKKIICLKHEFNWIKSLNLKGIASSHGRKMNRDESNQIKVMNQIIDLKKMRL